jgi:DNA polymerase-3 subunit epsilon
MALKGLDVAVFDFETTGVDAAKCWPVSVAVVHHKLGVVAEPELVLYELMKPPIPIPEGAAKIHGITDDMVSNAKSIPEVMSNILEMMEGRVICAYNMPYDWTILNRFTGKLSPKFFGIDPLVLVKTLDKYKKSKKLSDACSRRGIEIDAHNASSDALGSARLLDKLLEEAGLLGEDMSSFWERQKARAVEQEEDFAKWRMSKGQSKPDMRWKTILEEECLEK